MKFTALLHDLTSRILDLHMLSMARASLNDKPSKLRKSANINHIDPGVGTDLFERVHKCRANLLGEAPSCLHIAIGRDGNRESDVSIRLSVFPLDRSRTHQPDPRRSFSLRTNTRSSI